MTSGGCRPRSRDCEAGCSVSHRSRPSIVAPRWAVVTDDVVHCGLTSPTNTQRFATCWPCPVSERLAKQKIGAVQLIRMKRIFSLSCLANRWLDTAAVVPRRSTSRGHIAMPSVAQQMNVPMQPSHQVHITMLQYYTCMQYTVRHKIIHTQK